MRRGWILATAIGVVTAILIVIGTLFPISSAVYYANSPTHTQPPTTPLAAAADLGSLLRATNWGAAYAGLANKAQFSEAEFLADLKGATLSLRTFATLTSYDTRPLHASANTAEVLMNLHWSSVVGSFTTSRDLHLVKNGDRWQVSWPLVKAPQVPPQVIPVNYLRWDVIYPASGDDWGAVSVEGPHVRIVDMRPLNRAAGMVVMGELLNEDVIPAFVSVRATLVRKDGSVIASSGSFDMMLHTLLPKQVTPYLIEFPGVDLTQVASIRMQPLATLVPASADPVIQVDNQKFGLDPEPALVGQLSDQSGQTVNFSHVLSTFYNKNGQVVWVAGDYTSRALHPQIPVPFRIPVPADLSGQISSERTVVATYIPGGLR